MALDGSLEGLFQSFSEVAKLLFASEVMFPGPLVVTWGLLARPLGAPLNPGLEGMGSSLVFSRSLPDLRGLLGVFL